MIDLLLDGPRGQQPVHGDLPSLAYAPRPLPGLRVCGGVPVRIIDDDTVSTSEVDAQTPHTSGQQEGKDGIILKKENYYQLIKRLPIEVRKEIKLKMTTRSPG